jgi:NAD(P)-dependent dehydrogenase (short-subunit alcohol dehydrogenase family)
VTRGPVLVTGASTGIGEACAVHLAGLGHHVFAGIRKEADGERLVQTAAGRLTPVMLDVTDADAVEAAAKSVESEAGSTGVAGVVNNAGIGIGGPVEYLDLDDWRRQFEVNLFGQLSVTQAMLPLLRAGRGRIVFIGSIGGRMSTPLLAPYNASKFALEAVAESLRHELHPWGLHVSLVEPGAVKTPIWEKARSLADEMEERLPAEAAERYRPFIQDVRRAVDYQEEHGIAPIDVARAVERALHAPRPRTRYPVGLDAKAQALAVRLLPDRARDALVRRVMKRMA